MQFKHLDLSIGPYDPERVGEENFLYSSWIRSFQELPPQNSWPSQMYHRGQRRIIDTILKNEQTIVLMAHDSESRGNLHGFIVATRVRDSVVVHWISVRESARRLGLANALLGAALDEIGEGATQLFYTHHTRLAKKAEAMGMVFLPIIELLKSNQQQRASR